MSDDFFLPATARIGRVDLSVADVDEVSQFYRRVIGLEPVDTPGDFVDLGTDENAILRLVPDSTRPPRGQEEAGLFHLAIRVPDRQALAAVSNRLREGQFLSGASDHLVSEALYSRDPENNGVEVYRDRPRSEWQTTPEGGVRLVTWPLDLDELEESIAGEHLPLPDETTMGHVHLEVSGLDRSCRFYDETIGFDVTYRMNGARFLSAGGYHHHLGLNVWNGRSAPANGRGLERYAIEVDDASELDRFETSLSDAGITFNRSPSAVILRDPDDVEVQLVVTD